MEGSSRLNKYLAHTTGISRREADLWITQGRVQVNSTTAILGTPVHPGDRITVDGRTIAGAITYTYLALNKPAGYVCSRRRQGDHPTIYELLPAQYHALKPVGRLDRDSSGLILLTSDGDFAHRMTHPSFVKTKVYHVSLDKPLEPLHMQMISDYGVALEDGVSRFLVSKIEPATRDMRYEVRGKSSYKNKTIAAGDTPPTHDSYLITYNSLRYEVTMHEGRNRQIRRTFAALGYRVVTLHRISFGPYQLSDIKSGKFVPVDKK